MFSGLEAPAGYLTGRRWFPGPQHIISPDSDPMYEISGSTVVEVRTPLLPAHISSGVVAFLTEPMQISPRRQLKRTQQSSV